MSTETLKNWAGFASIVWMLAGYAIIFFLVAPFDRHFIPEWLFMLAILVGWLGVGLMLAIFGLRRGSLVGRICSVVGLIVFVYFAWAVWLSPALTRARQRGSASNEITSLDAAMSFSLRIAPQRRGASEFLR